MTSDEDAQVKSTKPRELSPVAVTGGSGYVGSVIARHLLSNGTTVRLLARSSKRLSIEGTEYAAFDLARRPATEALEGVRSLVHAAYDFHPTSWNEIRRINVDGSRRLFEAAKTAGVEEVVYVSSVAAFPGCASLYGQAKLLIEQAAFDTGAVVIRPGLVWSESSGALFASLQRVATRLPVLPLFVPDNVKLFLVHEGDLATSVERALSSNLGGQQAACFIAASREGVSLRSLLGGVVARGGKRPHFVPIPWRMLWGGLRTMELLRVPAPFRSDSVTSLVHAVPAPFRHARDIATLGIDCRPYRV